MEWILQYIEKNGAISTDTESQEKFVIAITAKTVLVQISIIFLNVRADYDRYISPR